MQVEKSCVRTHLEVIVLQFVFFVGKWGMPLTLGLMERRKEFSWF